MARIVTMAGRSSWLSPSISTFLWLWICVTAFSGTTALASTIHHDVPEDHDNTGSDAALAVLQWLLDQPNALVSEKVEARNGGIFAVSDISKDEVVFHIPRASLVFPEEVEDDENMECALAQQLVSLLKEESDHPYLHYIWKEFPHNLLPSNWTPRAKQILQHDLLNRDLGRSNFQPWESQSYQGTCASEEDLSSSHSPEEIDLLDAAFRIVLSRGWVGTLVPGYDMVNHRNGPHWRNVDKIMPESPEDWDSEYPLQNRDDFRVVAIQDIPAGTQLHNSYNDCGIQDPTCYGMKMNYGTLHIFQEYGFVEDFPQTWSFETRIGEGSVDEDDDDEDDERPNPIQRIGWELDYDDETQKYTITWLPVNARQQTDRAPSPTFGQFNWLHAQTQRLEEIDIESLTTNLPQHEKSALVELYRAMVTAFSQATGQLYNEFNGIDRYGINLDQQIESEAKETVESTRSEMVIDAVPQHTAAAAVDMESSASDSSSGATAESNSWNGDQSASAFVNASESLLEAYHQSPERLLTTPPVDRLNYEFTISQECVTNDDFPTHIDQSSSFYQSIHFHQHALTKNTCLWLSDWLQSCTSFRPHYHEWIVHYPALFLPKVERVLFLGGGDIMILHEIMKYEDQLEFVIGMELDQQVVRQSFRNSAILPQFHHPKVQWHFGDATKSLLSLPKDYVGTFDLVLVDLQNFVVDTVMVTETESIMDVALKMLKPTGVLARNEDFVQRMHADFTEFVVDIEIQDVPRLCQQSLTVGSPTIDFLKAPLVNHGLEHQYFEYPGGRPTQRDQHPTDRWTVYRHALSNQDKAAVLDESLPSSPKPSHGILHILDVENVSLDLANASTIHERVTTSLQQQGLALVETKGLDVLANEEPDGYSLVWILKQGYVSLSTWPSSRYAAMDIVLWSDFDIQFSVIRGVVEAVGGKPESGDTTSYSLITGGMTGVSSKTTEAPLNPPSSMKSPENDSVLHDKQSSPLDTVDTEILLENLTIGLLLHNPKVIVLCPDPSQRCLAIEAFSKKSKNSVALCACPSMFRNGTIVEGADFASCLRETWNSLKESVAVSGLFNAIVIDENAPLEMGQALYDTMSDAQRKMKVMSSKYVVLTVGTDTWKSDLLERFRTELAIFNPVFSTSISVTGQLISILSKGDNAFYAHLAQAVVSMEGAIGETIDVHDSKSGVVSFIPNFFPSKFVRNDMYDTSQARAQWNSQQLLGQQSILQFEIRLPKTPLRVNDQILFNHHEHNWYGIWIEGTVLSVDPSGSKYDIQLLNGAQNFAVDRNRLVNLRLPSSSLKFGDRVLARSDAEESFEAVWNQGSITGVNEDGSYKVRLFEDSYGEHVFFEGNLVYQFEMPDPKAELSFSTEEMRNVLNDAMKAMFGPQDAFEVELTDSVGDGAIAVCIGDDILLVATWDGKVHLTINFFSYEHEESTDGLASLLSKYMVESVAYLAVASVDNQPRGSGRIVNDWNDLNSFWFGLLYGREHEHYTEDRNEDED